MRSYRHQCTTHLNESTNVQSLNITRQIRPTKQLQLWSIVVAIASTTVATVCAQPPSSHTTQAAYSAVRGISSPSLQTRSPATVAPETTLTDSQTSTPRSATKDADTTTPTGNAQPVEGGQILARIDGQIVLASDVLWQVNQLIEANLERIPPNKINEAKQSLLRQQVMGLIDTKILYADFRRKVPAENMPTIEENLAGPFNEQEVPRLVKMLDLENRAALDTLLRKSGTSIADVQRQFIERTIAGEWLRQMVPKPEEVTHQQMLDYYAEHQKDFEFPAKAKWEEVMISFARSNDDRTAAWKNITSIGNETWEQVSKQPGMRGAVFTEIAPAKSHGFNAKEGGLHDWTTKGSLRCTEIDEALFSLRVGQLSNVIESERGFHIVRVLDREEAGRVPFTEAQVKIREELENKQRKGLADQQLAKIRKKSHVWTLFDGDIDTAQLNQMRGPSGRR